MDVLNFWLDSYKDPMFLKFPIATLVLAFVGFLVFALPLTLLAYLDPEPLRKYKVQQKPFQVKKYFWPSIGRHCMNAAIMAVVICFLWPFLRLISNGRIVDGAMPAWYIIVAQILFFIYFDDFILFWIHRALHSGWLKRNVHSVHHRITRACAIDNAYFHWIEYLMIGGVGTVAPLITGTHIYVLYGWILFRQFQGADGHCGYVFPWNPAHLIPLYEGGDYHDFHHSSYNGNYAGYLNYLDRFTQTYSGAYLRWKESRALAGAKGFLKLNWLGGGDKKADVELGGNS
ncbi:sterol desaturase family protein [Melittangium boletus]|uniref:sterol desaturase family protein n=1 Tax=Melittangium boletus TaxID=83453 RepID=UPI003DA4B098